jgi:IS4 transposase
MLEEILARFEAHAPLSVMMRLALEQAMPAGWIDEVFEATRQRQYPRELLFSTVVKLTSLVSLGLRPSLHAAAKKETELPVSIAALYDKVRRTEPAILSKLVQQSAQRLVPVVEAMGVTQSLPGWQLRVVEGNHLPASEKRLGPLRGYRGAALPGQTLVVYDADRGLVTDIVACEDAHAHERAAMGPLLESAQPGQLWMADRNFCTRDIAQGWDKAGAGFIVREHEKHPRLIEQGDWVACGRVETGTLQEQAIRIEEGQQPWRRIELQLDQATEDGDTVLRLWSNLPQTVGAQQIASLYRKRWRIEGMFQRLEAVLNSEIRSLGHPRAALLGFAVAIMAYNVLHLLKHSIERAHRQELPDLDVSTYYIAVDLRAEYAGMLIVLPAETWQCWSDADARSMADRLLELARQLDPRRLATHKRAPKVKKPKGYVDAATARAHVSTASVLEMARGKRP